MSRAAAPPGFSRADPHAHTTYRDGTANPEDNSVFTRTRTVEDARKPVSAENPAGSLIASGPPPAAVR